MPQTRRVSNHNKPCHQLGAEILREGQGALRGQSAQGRTHEWGHAEGAGAGWGLAEPGLYLGLTDSTLRNFINFPMSPLGSKLSNGFPLCLQ